MIHSVLSAEEIEVNEWHQIGNPSGDMVYKVTLLKSFQKSSYNASVGFNGLFKCTMMIISFVDLKKLWG